MVVATAKGPESKEQRPPIALKSNNEHFRKSHLERNWCSLEEEILHRSERPFRVSWRQYHQNPESKYSRWCKEKPPCPKLPRENNEAWDPKDSASTSRIWKSLKDEEEPHRLREAVPVSCSYGGGIQSNHHSFWWILWHIRGMCQ